MKMRKIRNPYTGKIITVSSAVPYAGKPGKKKDAYCARTAKIKGDWKRNKKSKNLVQRRRWKCPYIPGELRLRGRKK
jgi:deoxyinosine 3'endonuclease (endonuclease V)